MKKSVYASLLFLAVVFCSFSKKTDRQHWVSEMDRFARPVLENLANGTLKANMPVERCEGNRRHREDYSHLEALGRLLDGMAPWLELGPDNTREGKLRSEYIGLACKAIANAVDPASPDHLNFNRGAQPLVDAAFLAQGLLRAPTQLWGNLDAVTKERLVNELKSSRVIKAYQNNWLLFASTIEAALLEFTGEWDEERALDGVRRFRDDWYVGDGLYGDGATFHADYYNSFVIHPMLYQVLLTLSSHGVSEAEAFLPVEAVRYARYAAILEGLISPEGSFPCIGRSICYRCGAMHALSDVALRGMLPEGISAAQVRSALTAVIRTQMSASGTYDAKGWLTLGFAGHQPGLAENYISTGSLYLCSFAFVALGLPETDPFWIAPAKPWTARKAWGGVDLKADHSIKN